MLLINMLDFIYLYIFCSLNKLRKFENDHIYMWIVFILGIIEIKDSYNFKKQSLVLLRHILF